MLSALKHPIWFDDHGFVQHRWGRDRYQMAFGWSDVHKKETEVDELSFDIEFFVVNAHNFTNIERMIEVQNQTCCDIR